MVLRLALAALASLPLAGCMATEGPRYADRDDVPPARVTGEPVNCIQLSSINTTRVRDDRTIDFLRGSNRGWRNTLPNTCPGLATQDGFTYDTSLGRLCNVDIINVLERAGGLRRGVGCGLGRFVPIELAQP